MERAFDQVAIDFTFRQGRLAVGAGVIGDVKISIEIIDRERYMVWWVNATYVPRRYFLGTAQINHMCYPVCSPCAAMKRASSKLCGTFGAPR